MEVTGGAAHERGHPGEEALRPSHVRGLDCPGETGRIAVILDLPPADSIKTGDMLVLELYRDGGLRQGYVELDLAALAARIRRRGTFVP